ncbi:AAA family ATPase [Aeromicrobium senzhongii]|uniref:AAA family ATPase n=1 Tax=Aeromicrobium senzhongii TaxID=2663859 RepID=A0ABX6SVU9_9ACTN|nr:AAA family ATPase [Aeromicrobium senzhongii]MTB87409.1 AAA domain-containing protein [Aeromicrobium senzhongii]QNL95534.1 AAA family ATPase [Aeromicrobium senzhongii]
MKVERIWWRDIGPEDFFAMERSGRTLRGRTAVEIAQVPALLEFIGVDRNLPHDKWQDARIVPRVIGAPEVEAALVFRPARRHHVYELHSQNRHDERHERHPAWLPGHGWPDLRTPQSVDDAKTILADIGGLHVYVARTQSGAYFAGSTTGTELPEGWPSSCEPLFTGVDSGVITVGSGSLQNLTPLARKILEAFRDRKSVLVYGPPATGKTHAVAQVRQILDEAWTAGEAIDIDPQRADHPFTSGFESSPIAPPVITDWVTFHQEYGYEDFIVGLRPTGEGIRLAPFAGRLLDLAIRLDRQGKGSSLLVIDEINRGNVPKILGDFMTYMDDSYRVAPDGDTRSAIPVNLPKVQRSPTGDPVTEPIWLISGDSYMLPQPWFFPHDLHILATMNSVDRAVAPLDSAIGRRFERIDAYADLDFLAQHLGVSLEVATSPDVDAEHWTPQAAAVALLAYLNDEITERLGQDYELGHLYFWKIATWADLKRVWDHDVWPQIRDRFGARPDQLADLLRVNSRHAPADYPFRTRTLTGRALAVDPLMGRSDEDAAITFDFLVRG